MDLIIDIGNTRSKLALFRNEKMIVQRSVEKITEPILTELILEYGTIKNAMISSVGEKEEKIANILSKKSVYTLILSDSTPLPFINDYETKETLGRDRIAAIAGACSLYPEKDTLVIDAGTAITYDLKNSGEHYLGGNISPGLTMRFKALNEFTARLPLLKPDESYGFPSRNTNEAIISGVQQGVIFEINGYIETVQKQYSDVVVILTGGDSHFFDNKLKKTIFVVPDLILMGLNSILKYNVKTE